MPVSQTARDNVTIAKETETEQLAAEVQTLVDQIFDGPLDPTLKNNLFTEACSVLTGVRIASTTNPLALSGGNPIAQLLSGSNTSPAALTGGSAAGNDDDIVLTGDDAIKYRTLLQMFGGSNGRMLDNARSLFSPLQNLLPNELADLLTIMVKVADRNIKVVHDAAGNPILESEKKLSIAETNLSAQQAEVARLRTAAAATPAPARAAAPVAATPATDDALKALTELVNSGKYVVTGIRRDTKALVINRKLTDMSDETRDLVTSIKAP